MRKGTVASDRKGRKRQGNCGDTEKEKVRNIGKMAGLRYRNKNK